MEKFISFKSYKEEEILNEIYRLLEEDNLNEKIDFRNYAAIIGLVATMALSLHGRNITNDNIEKMKNNKEIQKITNNIVDKKIDKSNIKDIIKAIHFKNFNQNKSSNLFQVDDTLIDNINQGKDSKNLRLLSKYKERYNKYDNDIEKAVNTLKTKGFKKVDPNFLKAFMLIETGMNPSENSLGYFGFPQTKEHLIDEVNKKFKTDFTKSDMNKAYESSMYIFYRLLLNAKSKHVSTDSVEDLVASYNWGIGNLHKFKLGKKEMPNETKNYINMMKKIEKEIQLPFKLRG